MATAKNFPEGVLDFRIFHLRLVTNALCFFKETNHTTFPYHNKYSLSSPSSYLSHPFEESMKYDVRFLIKQEKYTLY